VKRLAVAIDDENAYFSLAVLIGLLDGDVRDLSVRRFALGAGGAFK
jgi:hypothetical protein